jgi:hypothetical protein
MSLKHPATNLIHARGNSLLLSVSYLRQMASPHTGRRQIPAPVAPGYLIDLRSTAQCNSVKDWPGAWSA